jgi:hypothetical protein
MRPNHPGLAPRAAERGRIVNTPPAVAGQRIRHSPADGIALLHHRYDVRAADGLLLCTVSRDAAAREIAAGTVELCQGPHGAYLRPAANGPLPDNRTHHGGHRTWHGPVEPGQGAPANYDHARFVCKRWRDRV